MKRFALAVLMLGSSSLVSAANLIQNGDFEITSFGVASGGVYTFGGGNVTSLNNWTVTGPCAGNCVLLLDTNYTELGGAITFQSQSGSNSVDLTGFGNTLTGGLQQTVSTAVGTSYQLSFYLGNMDDRFPSYGNASSVQVFVNGLSQGIFSNGNNTNNRINWALNSLTFTANSSATTIGFVNATASTDFEAGLDNVSLNVVPVPEPETYAMLLAGLGLLAFAARRRKLRAA